MSQRSARDRTVALRFACATVLAWICRSVSIFQREPFAIIPLALSHAVTDAIERVFGQRAVYFDCLLADGVGTAAGELRLRHGRCWAARSNNDPFLLDGVPHFQ